jgi:hypothetical protein
MNEKNVCFDMIAISGMIPEFAFKLTLQGMPCVNGSHSCMAHIAKATLRQHRKLAFGFVSFAY